MDKQLPQMKDALPTGDMLREIPSAGQTSDLQSRKQITSQNSVVKGKLKVLKNDST